MPKPAGTLASGAEFCSAALRSCAIDGPLCGSVRANDAATAIPPKDQPWDGTRVLYLQHPSDPIVWWSPHLIWSQPDWISEAPGQDVLKTMFWMPIVTFWQVTADLPFATGVPDGHGHRYSAEYVDGFNAVMRAGLTSQQLTSLRTIIGKVR